MLMIFHLEISFKIVSSKFFEKFNLGMMVLFGDILISHGISLMNCMMSDHKIESLYLSKMSHVWN